MMMSYGTSFRKSAQKNQNVSDEQAEESKTKLDTQAETQQQFYRPILRPESRNVHSAQKSAFSEAPQFHNQEELSTLLGPTHSGKSSLSKTSTDFFRSRRNIRSASVTNKMVRVKEEPGDSSQQNSVEKPRVLVKSHSSVKVGQYTQEMARMQKVEAAWWIVYIVLRSWRIHYWLPKKSTRVLFHNELYNLIRKESTLIIFFLNCIKFWFPHFKEYWNIITVIKN